MRDDEVVAGADDVAAVTPAVVQSIPIPAHVQQAMLRHRQRIVDAKQVVAEAEHVLAEIAFAWSGVGGMVLDLDNWAAIPPDDQGE